MTACYVCDRPIPEGVGSYAMRVIAPGPGLVQVCSARCADDKKFSLRGRAKTPAREKKART